MSTGGLGVDGRTIGWAAEITPPDVTVLVVPPGVVVPDVVVPDVVVFGIVAPDVVVVIKLTFDFVLTPVMLWA